MLLLNRSINVNAAKIYIRGFHVSRILSSGKKVLGKDPDTLEEVDSELLNKGLEDLRNNSWEKSASEVLSEELTSFKEAFPHFSEGELEEITKNNLNFILRRLQARSIKNDNDLNSILTIQDILKKSGSVELVEQSKLYSWIEIQSKLNGNFTAMYDHLKKEGLFDSKEASQNFIEINGSKLTIDLDQGQQIIEKGIEFYQAHREKLQLGADLFIPTVGLYLIYSKINKTLHNQINPPVKTSFYSSILNTLHQLQNRRLALTNHLASVLIGTSLFFISNLYLDFIKTPVKVDLNYSNTETSEIKKSFIFVSLMRNIPGWLKYIIFILSSFLLYYFRDSLPLLVNIYKFLINNSFWFILGIIIILSCIIIYYLVTLFLLNRFSILSDKEIITDYINNKYPKFIKNYLIELKNISSNKQTLNMFLHLYIISTIFIFTSLFFLLLAFSTLILLHL